MKVFSFAAAFMAVIAIVMVPAVSWDYGGDAGATSASTKVVYEILSGFQKLENPSKNVSDSTKHIWITQGWKESHSSGRAIDHIINWDFATTAGQEVYFSIRHVSGDSELRAFSVRRDPYADIDAHPYCDGVDVQIVEFTDGSAYARAIIEYVHVNPGGGLPPGGLLLKTGQQKTEAPLGKVLLEDNQLCENKNLHRGVHLHQAATEGSEVLNCHLPTSGSPYPAISRSTWMMKVEFTPAKPQPRSAACQSTPTPETEDDVSVGDDETTPTTTVTTTPTDDGGDDDTATVTVTPPTPVTTPAKTPTPTSTATVTVTTTPTDDGGDDDTATVTVTPPTPVTTPAKTPTPTSTATPVTAPAPTPTATATATPDPYAKPTSLVLNRDSGDADRLNLTFRWSGASPYLVAWELERAPGDSGPYRRVASKTDSSSPVSFDGLARGNWYRAQGWACLHDSDLGADGSTGPSGNPQLTCGAPAWSNRMWLPGSARRSPAPSAT